MISELTNLNPHHNINTISDMSHKRNSIMYIEKPKLRIKDLKELQAPEIIKLSKDKSYIPLVCSQANNFVKNGDLCSPITNQLHENENVRSQMNDLLLPSNRKSSSRILELQLKESLLNERLMKLEESRALYLRNKEKRLISSNESCPIKDLGGTSSALNSKEQSKLKTGEEGGKSKPVFETDNISLHNYKKDSCFNTNIDFKTNPTQDSRKETANYFEFINMSEDSFGVFEKECDMSESVCTSCTENIQSMSVDKCYSDLKSEKLNIIQPELPKIEISEKVDSTSLRDGIIKASRTLINTQKALKLLLQITSRAKSLPTKQTTSLINKFHGILNLLDKRFHEIDQTISYKYEYIFSEFDTGKSLIFNEQKKEILKEEDENCQKDTVFEQPNSFICRSKLQTENIGEKGNASRRKKTRRKAYNSDDEKIDKTFIPVTKSQICPSKSRRVGYERSCRKRKICVDSEL